jgi:uncharacterized membrane protein (UPF0127 family)
MSEDTKRPVIMPEVPRQMHMVMCKSCKKDFPTRYSYQVYCRNPCKAETPAKPKRVKKVLEGTAAQRKKIAEEKRRQTTLRNRALFATRL